MVFIFWEGEGVALYLVEKVMIYLTNSKHPKCSSTICADDHLKIHRFRNGIVFIFHDLHFKTISSIGSLKFFLCLIQ